MDLDTVVHAFLECALWSECSYDEECNGGSPLDDDFDIDDLTEEARTEARKDCESFITDPEVVRLVEECDLSDEQVGHDFLLTRNGHGAGFWDRGLGEAGDKLSKLCKPYGSFHLMNGGDGKVYHHG